MKRVILAALSLCFLQYVGNAQNVQQSGRTQPMGAGAQVNCQKKVENCAKRVEYYQKQATQAEQQGNKDLAAVYTKCADAKQKIADGMTKVYENSQICQQILSENPEMKTAICGPDNPNCMMGQGKKGMRMTTHIKNMQKCIEACQQKSKQFEKDGEQDVSNLYNELGIAMQEKVDGLKLAAEGKKDFKAARNQLKTLTTPAAKEEPSAEE